MLFPWKKKKQLEVHEIRKLHTLSLLAPFVPNKPWQEQFAKKMELTERLQSEAETLKQKEITELIWGPYFSHYSQNQPEKVPQTPMKDPEPLQPRFRHKRSTYPELPSIPAQIKVDASPEASSSLKQKIKYFSETGLSEYGKPRKPSGRNLTPWARDERGVGGGIASKTREDKRKQLPPPSGEENEETGAEERLPEM